MLVLLVGIASGAGAQFAYFPHVPSVAVPQQRSNRQMDLGPRPCLAVAQGPDLIGDSIIGAPKMVVI